MKKGFFIFDVVFPAPHIIIIDMDLTKVFNVQVFHFTFWWIIQTKGNYEWSECWMNDEWMNEWMNDQIMNEWMNEWMINSKLFFFFLMSFFFRITNWKYRLFVYLFMKELSGIVHGSVNFGLTIYELWWVKPQNVNSRRVARSFLN